MVHLLSASDEINNLCLFDGVQKNRLDLTTLQTDKHTDGIFILLKNLDKDLLYKCSVGVEDEHGNVQELISRQFSLTGI